MEKTHICPIAMTKEYWAGSHLSIARYYGGIQFNGHEYQIVNKHGVTFFELSDPSEPADLVRKDFITYYRRLGRDRFLEVMEEHQLTSDKELKKIYRELTKK